MGTLYVDVHGKMTCQNLNKGLKCEINISRQGWTTKVPNKIEGKVMDKSGKVIYEITGRWSEAITIKNVETQVLHDVFKADPRHPMENRYYFLPTFSMNTNYCDDIILS